MHFPWPSSDITLDFTSSNSHAFSRPPSRPSYCSPSDRCYLVIPKLAWSLLEFRDLFSHRSWTQIPRGSGKENERVDESDAIGSGVELGKLEIKCSAKKDLGIFFWNHVQARFIHPQCWATVSPKCLSLAFESGSHCVSKRKGISTEISEPQRSQTVHQEPGAGVCPTLLHSLWPLAGLFQIPFCFYFDLIWASWASWQ